MKLNNILTRRNWEHWPSWDLVYEWEDNLAENLNLKKKNLLRYSEYGKGSKYLNKILLPKKNTLIFELTQMDGYHPYNKKNFIPFIIDFYLPTSKFKDFEREYSRNPVVFISNYDAYKNLKQKFPNMQINLQHLPLSISDKYKLNPETKFQKEYDVVLFGRQNPVLEKYLYQYAEENKDLNYVYRKLENGKFNYYTSKGECLENISKRDIYISLITKSKVTLYSTPGIDGGENYTNGYNQVTPRFLEALACGCNVICRYKENLDTEYYRLQEFSKNIDTYKDFCQAMDKALNTEADIKKYSEYLQQHYTSTVAKQMQEILEKI